MFLVSGVEGGEGMERVVDSLYPRTQLSIGSNAGVLGLSIGFSVTFLLLNTRLDTSRVPGNWKSDDRDGKGVAAVGKRDPVPVSGLPYILGVPSLLISFNLCEIYKAGVQCTVRQLYDFMHTS